MRVPDYILSCIAFLGDVVPGAVDDSFNHDATAFFVSVPSRVSNAGDYNYLVTAKHVLKRPNPAFRVNTSFGKAQCIRPDDNSVQWYFHPSDTEVDIAVTGIVPESEADITAIPIDVLLTPDRIKTLDIGIGDEVFFPGLFWRAPGIRKNTPILRMGNLAMFPEDPIAIDLPSGAYGTMEAYLIEARSMGGISGSPVFVKQTITRKINDEDVPIRQVQLPSHFHLLGLMHGHWDVKESDINSPRVIPSARGVNLGIAIVVPAHKIIETINHPELVAGRERADLELLRAITPTPD